MSAHLGSVERALESAARDVLYISESEAPLALYRWRGEGEPSPEALLAQEGLPAETPVEVTTVESELGPMAEAPPGADEQAQADAARFGELLDVLRRELTDLRVYRVGKVDIDLYVLGRSSAGAWLGYKTHAVET